MRRREREKIIEKTEGFSTTVYGTPLYFRPFQPDGQKIAEISKFTGERKSAIAQKLVHLALVGKDLKFSDSRLEEKIDWLIKNERHRGALSESLAQRLEEIDERIERVEGDLQMLSENSRQTSTMTSEIYCMVSIAISSLNQIFTKLLEFLSPIELERKCSVDVANRIMAGLIEHSVDELDKCSEHHGLDYYEAAPKNLYIFSKIARIKERLGVSDPVKKSTRDSDGNIE